MNRREQRTHKTLWRQRDEAQAIAASSRAELDAIRGRAGALAADEVDRIRRGAETAVAEARREAKRAIESRDALEQSFDIAVGVEVGRHTDACRAQLEAVRAELASLKVEDIKAVRRRLHAKTERVAELERTLAERDRRISSLTRPPVYLQTRERIGL